MKDNFSKQASAYAQFRPHYPDDMLSYIVSFVRNKTTALDIATGNGQVAVKLAAYFQAVYATDISDKQLENAPAVANIVYKLESAEHTDFKDAQFDLITVAQAVHWFQFDVFYKEIVRILKPDGIFAIMGYGRFSTHSDSGKILMDYYHNIVGSYWDSERKYLEENYQTIPFPLDEIETKKFSNTFEWTFEQLIGYLETWSATQHYKNKNLKNPIDIIYQDLKISWEKGDKKVHFPLLLRMGTLKKQH